MNEPRIDPQDSPLSKLLRTTCPSPNLPPRFQEGVWRRIETAEARGVVTFAPGWIEAFAALILRPRSAFAAAAVLILAGGWLGVHEGTQVARLDAQARYVAAVAPNALH